MGLLDEQSEGDMIVDPRIQARNVDRARERGARSFQEAKPKDTYYRPEFGWIMSDIDVAGAKAIKGNYDQAISDYTASIESAKEAYAVALENGEEEIDTAYSPVLDAKLYPVNVVNDNKIEGTYYFTKEAIDEMDAKSFNQGKGSWNGMWDEKGEGYYVDVKTIGGLVRGAELHEALGAPAQEFQEYINNAKEEKEALYSGLHAAGEETMAGYQEVWDKELATLTGGYDKWKSDNKTAYEEKKADYSQSVIGTNAGLLESKLGKVKL